MFVEKIPLHATPRGLLHAIVETPRGARNKYDFEPVSGAFQLKKVLPKGAAFPFDFGFFPHTEGEDGDPVDVLVMMDEPAFPGCLVACRLVGVMRAKQRDGRETVRNDRFIAVAGSSLAHQEVVDARELPRHILNEVERFFVSYNELEGREFIPQGILGPKKAAKLLQRAIKKL